MICGGSISLRFPNADDGRQPTSVAPHCLYDFNGIMRGYGYGVHGRVHRCQGDETCRAAIAGTMIGKGQVVINGFGDADRLQVIAGCCAA